MTTKLAPTLASRASRMTLCALSGSTLLILTACGGSGTARSADGFRLNPSPAMSTLGQRGTDRANMYSRTTDTNWRAMNEDWDWFWNMDRPSRLHSNLKP